MHKMAPVHAESGCYWGLPHLRTYSRCTVKVCTAKRIRRVLVIMCKDCLNVKCPDRGTSCLEKGSYLMNFKGCSNCKALGFIEETNREETEEDDEETVTYTHVCKNCGHLIATHTYTFSQDGEFQEYSMECLLCGHGNSTNSILPHDPREKMLF